MVHSFQSLKVLIAEDHFPVRQLIATALRTKDVSLIDVATDGKKTRDMIDQAVREGQAYDIVFLDWEMPIVSGIDILKHYRAQPQFNHTAFVMVTSMSAQSQVLDAVKSGTTAYMVKPVSQGSIIKKLEEIMVWLEQKRPLG